MHLGIDLGTCNIRIAMPGKGVVLSEPAVVAVDRGTHQALAFGTQAVRLLERRPSRGLAVWPIRDGVMTDYYVTEALLRHCIERVAGRRLFRPQVMICVPAEVTSVEKRAVLETALSAGAGRAYLIETPLAAAMGAGLDVEEPGGILVVDIGGGVTDVAVISLGGVVLSHSVRTAGNKMDDAVARYLRKNYNLLIGERTAETIKIRIGSAWPDGGSTGMEIRGRDLIDGLPKTMAITSHEVRHALEETLKAMVCAVKTVLEQTPTELVPGLVRRGIVMTGGGSLLTGVETLFSRATGMPVRIAADAVSCVALGTGQAESLQL